MSLLMSEKQNKQKELIFILIVWPCLLVVPTTIFVMLGSLIFGEFNFIQAIKGGIALQACILLLSAPFSLAPILWFLATILQNFKFMYSREKGNKSDFLYPALLKFLFFYTILYMWHVIAIFLFNWSYHGELKFDTLDPFKLTHFLISYPFSL